MEHTVDTAKQQDRTHSPLSLGPEAPVAEPSLHPMLHLQRSVGNQAVLGLLRSGAIRAKLEIGSIDDPAEREADDIADRVMRMPADGLSIRRKCEACEEEEDRRLRMKPSGSPEAAGGEAPSSVHAVLGSSGEPLDTSSRAFFEPRFGQDFSPVRIHTDQRAAESARQIGAQAYAVGSHIAFAEGRYEPVSSTSRQLLAHELAHVVQGGPLVRRQPVPDVETRPRTRTVFLPHSERLLSGPLAAELVQLGLLPSSMSIGTIFYANGYGFTDWPANNTLALALEVTTTVDGKEVFTGYDVTTSAPAAAGPGGSPPQPQRPAPPSKPVAPIKAPAPKSSAVKRPTQTPPTSTPQTAQTSAPTSPKTADQLRAEYDALPEQVKDVLREGGELRPENQAQLLRIANKLKLLEPEDLALYKLLAKKLTTDLDAFERSVDFFVQFKAQIRAQAAAEKPPKEQTLEERLAKTWGQFDEKKFASLTVAQKEDLARDIAAEQRNIQLEYMASHPGETALGFAEGMVRIDKTAKAIVDDVKEAADGDKGAYSRIAGGVGALNKTVAAVASIVFVALLFVPGVNLLELAAAGLAVAAATIALSTVESELRIKAAGEAKSSQEFKAETAKSAAAQTQAVVAAALLALTLAAKIVARIPLPGRYQSVGVVMRSARTALLNKSGIGPAWQGLKADLLSKLRASKQGLPEALAEQSKATAETAGAVGSMSGDEFLNHLASGDPKLADLAISPEQAKAYQQIAATPEGKAVPEQLRQDALKALQDAPTEAAKKVDEFTRSVDDSVAEIEKTQDQGQLQSAVDDANNRLSGEQQARQAIEDEQAFVKKRLEGARRSGVREQAQKKLEALQAQKAETAGQIARLEKELSDATIKVNRLREKVLGLPHGSKERADALAEFNLAKQALEDLREADELGGYREERKKQAEAEEHILESLELKRPSLRESTKEAIRKAAKRNADGKFLDANTGEVIDGEPVYGHKYGRENRRLILEASERGMTQEQFNDWVNQHPEWFQLETEANNLSHRFEKPGID